MPKITKLTAQKKLPRVNVFLDGEYSFSLSLDTVLEHNIAKGDELSEEKINSLVEESEKEKLLNKILNFISYRQRSEKEVRDRLQQYLKDQAYGSDKLIATIISILEKQNLINDYVFTLWYITQRIEHRPKSQKEIYFDLFQKGISRDLISQALLELNYDEMCQIKKIIAKKISSNKPTPSQLKKITGYLLRRGFPYNLVKEALNDL